MKIISLHKSEQQCIAKAIANSRSAQKELYELHAPKMLSVCRYYVKDVQEAEDIMLTAFFKAFQNLKSFSNGGNFEGWLRRIMVNECISYYRKKKELLLTDNIETVSEHTENTIVSSYDVAEIQALIDELPKGYKMVFILYAVEGYKHQEIAKMLEISESTSKSQLFKARKLLQQKVAHLKIKEYGTTR
ncbi:MAG: RNA polymerase sigma factor [Flavobacteriaceae bacterium]